MTMAIGIAMTTTAAMAAICVVIPSAYVFQYLKKYISTAASAQYCRIYEYAVLINEYEYEYLEGR